ncbi:MAG TPA: TonB-dependent receptor, partial [Gemmatimonadaceae bacterium]
TLLRPTQRGAIDLPTRSSSRGGNARAEYALAADRTVYASATLLDEERDLGTPLTGSDRRIGALSAGADVGTLATGRVSANLFASSQGYHSRQARPGTARATESRAADQSIPSHDAGASLQWMRGSAEGAVLSAGADVRYMVGRMDEVVYGATGTTTGTRTAGGKQVVGGVFAQAAVVPLAPLRVEASVRVDGWRNWNGTRHDATANPARDTSYAERSDVALSPRLGVRWTALPGLAFRASGSKAFRAPTLSEQYRTFFSGPLTFQGNPDLGAERLTGADAGFDWQLHPRVELRATAFWNEMRDLAGFVDVGNNTRRRLNQGYARSRGAEGEVALRPADAITIVGSYNYDDARVTHVAKETRIARVPMQRAAARVRWAPGARGALSAVWRYEGSNIALGGAPLPHFGVVDLDARWAPRAGAELYASVQNVGDRAYVANRSGALEYLGLPRTIVVGVALR